MGLTAACLEEMLPRNHARKNTGSARMNAPPALLLGGKARIEDVLCVGKQLVFGGYLHLGTNEQMLMTGGGEDHAPVRAIRV